MPVINKFLLQAVPKAFRRCVIVAVSLARHGDPEASGFNLAAILMRTVLASPIGMVDTDPY